MKIQFELTPKRLLWPFKMWAHLAGMNSPLGILGSVLFTFASVAVAIPPGIAVYRTVIDPIAQWWIALWI